jgi:hypothetical protein
MKVMVNRNLNGGIYNVSFAVGNFTSEEVQKMSSFGTPTIDILTGQPAVHVKMSVPITQINPQLKAGFRDEQDARRYEEEVVNAIKSAMTTLREYQDNYSSKQEVDI